MPQFRKKPAVVEAMRITDIIRGAAEAWFDLPDWFRDAYEIGAIIISSDKLTIKTLEGSLVGNDDDWLIRGVAGEIYPCKADIFEKTYEAVDA